MNAFIRGLGLACALIVALPANAAIKVLATTSDWGQQHHGADRQPRQGVDQEPSAACTPVRPSNSVT